MRRPSHVPWIFLQMFHQISLHIPPYSSPAILVSIYHTTFLEDGISVLGGSLRGPWWCFLLWSAFECHIFCKCSSSFHLVLWYRAPLFRACSCWNLGCSRYFLEPLLSLWVLLCLMFALSKDNTGYLHLVWGGLLSH